MGVILYFISYGKLPLQHIKNQYQLMYAITDPLQKQIQYPPLDSISLNPLTPEVSPVIFDFERKSYIFKIKKNN